ncbi:MAG: tyrosine--tRNA ligase [Hyphomicrobiales bacterium]|nr:MAG: tyrosine--tRNA ligase [Hyphomicrobiales bacterium]
MTEYKSSFLREMDARGYIHQCSDAAALDAEADAGMLTAYIGFDCTAQSLHVGNLLGIMMLRKFQQAGHKPIVLIGGGTTKVGDPSGKDESRKMLSDEQIASNVAGIRKVFGQFLDFGDAPNSAIMVNNADWLDSLNYIEFLRDYGRHFTLNRMMAFDSVKLRLEREQPLTFLEFNYMIFQAYDYLELSRRHGCRLQMGGSDQWGNIINGIELGRRVDGRQLYALTTALLTTSSGAKMGKSVSGAVWLNADMLSPYDYWQFWRNSEDADVGRFLRLFTEVPLEEIAALEQAEGAEINAAKKLLATEATAMAHGREAAMQAARTAEETFEAGTASAGLPTVELARADIEAGLGVLNAFVTAGLAASNGEVRRFIKGGGAKVNDRPLSDPNAVLSPADISDEGVIKLSIGKKRHVLLKPA